MEIIDYSELDVYDVREIARKQEEEVLDKIEPVSEILEDVKDNGDLSVLRYTSRFDNADLDQDDLLVDDYAVERAYELVPDKDIKTIRRASENIRRFHSYTKPDSLKLNDFNGMQLGVKTDPLEAVGAYVPGGKAAYPSSALMTVVPAKVAGVEWISVCTPPSQEGEINPYTLVACDIAGADVVYRIGGVQAIGSLAFGTETVVPVDKIVGPGNAYVTAAKMLVRGTTEIDFPAGPSEVLIIADDSANPKQIAIDLLAQAEHDPNSLALLATNSHEFGEKVNKEIGKMVGDRDREEIIKKSLKKSMIVVGDLNDLTSFSNELGPEHLEIVVENPLKVLREIKHAGAIFIGSYAPVAVGDYATGCNHVLPTGGQAKVHSGLGTKDFMKTSSVQIVGREGLNKVADIAKRMAEIEGLEAHAYSIETRLED
ncbi:histidinol dehydrogenase [Methanonatronarchaeum sp. AMET-Sl]|uniref:histidinol dehydrogenase n=1 Tax=Methanonatronarchaeum sp. AMET-Sl TaxID=3037654 RepID=UPI00244E4C95|nr:histidinol dehydrogenase [Methanonatronarchaeum sp. AMET-Sl]WGI17842.1 histidinol dehydrogenase [Methanonatronarchaeum sp. AMET-Sl]